MRRGKKNKTAYHGKGNQKQRTETDYTEIPTENERCFNYYKVSQNNGVIPPDEFELFCTILKSPLPTTFRITGTKKYAQLLRDRLVNHYFKGLENVKIFGDDGLELPLIQPPTCLTWYPDSLAWTIHAGRTDFRRSEAYSKLHTFMVQETELGNINRQEAVSMIPPLFLDVQPHHRILDMCAAPGSKTCQIVEMIHTKSETSSVIPTGVIIANDIDPERSHMLIHQLKRLHSPSLIVTNNDATVYPTAYSADDHLPLLFDRILCDVPCSGDGTLRKNKLIWRTWNVGQGYGIHALQVDILTRGCQLLKEGGRLVYSTCSLNPVENEAVLQSVLQTFDGCLALVDVSDQLPSLIRRPALSSWKLTGTNPAHFYDKFEDVPQEERGKLHSDLFANSSLLKKHKISRAMRIYPYFQNTGGFFIVVIQKIAAMSSHDKIFAKNSNGYDVDNISSPHVPNAEENHHHPNSISSMTSPNDPKLSFEKISSSFEDPFIFQHQHSPTLQKVQSLFALNNTFPVEQLVIRSTNPQERNNLFLVSESVRSFLQAVNSNGKGRLKIAYCGVLAFTRCDGQPKISSTESVENRNEMKSTPLESSMSPSSSCISDSKDYAYRIQNEATYLIAPYVTQRLVTIPSRSDFDILLQIDYPSISEFSASFENVLTSLSFGCHLFSYSEGDEHSFVAPVWKGKASLNLLIHKKERKSVNERWQWSSNPNIE